MKSKWAAVCVLVGAWMIPGPAAAGDEIATRSIRFGHAHNADHPISAGVRKFAELVAAKSGGKLQVKEFPAHALGSEAQQLAALHDGAHEMHSSRTSALVGKLSDYGVIDFPFNCGNYQQAFALLDGPLGKTLLNKLPETGLVGLAYWDLGFRNVTSSRRAIARLEDIEGLRLRVRADPVLLESFTALKAFPVPMGLSELYMALETKTVDGQENLFAVIVSHKFYEVQKYVSATNHVYAASVVLVSRKFWDRLSPGEQKILKDAAIEARDYQRQLSMEAARKAVGELQAAGMLFNVVPESEKARMQQAVKPVVDKFLASYSPEMQRLVGPELARVRMLK